MRKRRRLLNIRSQKIAAQMVGVNAHTYAVWERGSVPSPDGYDKLAKWVGCPVEVLTSLKCAGTFPLTNEYRKRHRKKKLHSKTSLKPIHRKKKRKWLSDEEFKAQCEKNREKWLKKMEKAKERHAKWVRHMYMINMERKVKAQMEKDPTWKPPGI